MRVLLAALVLILAGAPSLVAKPPSQEEAARQAAVVAEFKAAFTAEATPAGQLAVLTRWMKDPEVEIRRKGLELAKVLKTPEADVFLTAVLADDVDAGIRSGAATTLGKLGSEKSLPALARAASKDPTTNIEIGCIVGQSSARRAATFALADLAARFPNQVEAATQALRALTPAADPQDNEQLADARAQALYQITHDAALLAPFLARLKNADAKTRERGVVAFRFFGLKEAPPELTATLKDADKDVRLWAALVIGEIADPRSAPLLVAVAADTKEDLGMRSNALHSLGRMKAQEVVPALRKLLEDEQEGIQVGAAIALNRITGEKVKQFPAGYPAAPPGCQ